MTGNAARTGLLLVCGLLVGQAGVGGAGPYEFEAVRDGGVLRGRVGLNGPAPEPRVFPLVLYAFGEFCKKISDGQGRVLLKEFNVDGDGGLKDAVVAIQHVAGGKGFKYRDTELVTVNCMFHPADVPDNEQFELHDGKLVHVHPLVTVMRNHTQLLVDNRDPIVHAAQVYRPEKGNRVLSFPIPVSRGRKGGYMDLDEGRQVAQIICGMHEYMQTWAWVVDNPYFSKTEKGGEYRIDRIPPGTYRVTAWHPHMKPIEKEITIPPNGTAELDFEFDAREVIRPVYETQRQFRISPQRDPTVDLMGCEGPFCVNDPAHSSTHMK